MAGEQIELKVVYEDESFIVIDKPPGSSCIPEREIRAAPLSMR